jgi:hypothetical protein
MTAYRDRLEEGHYEAGTIRTSRADEGEEPEPQTESESEPEEEEPEEEPEPAQEPEPEDEDLEGKTLVELREEAESLGVASYGTKAQIRERIEEARAA